VISAVVERQNNPLALTGFIIGIAGVFFHFIGVVPVAGIVLSSLGLGSFKPASQKNKWMAGWGLALSIIGTVMYLDAYGHLH
jgi:hypothetical protein